MLTIWFWLVALMITAYVVLDGFDLGVGRSAPVFSANGGRPKAADPHHRPVWDGNEVWLLAGGGTLYFAFPLLYASGFSGFYLPLMIVLWLLILRGIGIELRMHLDSPVWRGLFNGAFGIASLLLTFFFGAALGNVIRGVPLDRDGYFFLPLWTDWQVGPQPGDSGLVHGDRGCGGAGRAVSSWRQLRGAQNIRRFECTCANRRAPVVAGAAGRDDRQLVGNARDPAGVAQELPEMHRRYM